MTRDSYHELRELREGRDDIPCVRNVISHEETGHYWQPYGLA